MFDPSNKILIIGTNDNATACALRLFRVGFYISLVSRKTSFDLHYFRNFSPVLSIGSKEINNVKAQSYADFLYNGEGAEKDAVQGFIEFSNNDRKLCVLSEKDLGQIRPRQFDYCTICDSLLFNSLNIDPAGCVTISCKKDINADYLVIEKGAFTGNVSYNFLQIPGYDSQENNIIYSAMEGLFIAEKNPGEKCKRGERIARINNQDILSDRDGIIDGIIQSGIIVNENIPVISIGNQIKYNPKTLPLESFAVAGGVLEAVMFHKRQNPIE